MFNSHIKIDAASRLDILLTTKASELLTRHSMHYMQSLGGADCHYTIDLPKWSCLWVEERIAPLELRPSHVGNQAEFGRSIKRYPWRS